jgi:hypothetical protein
MFDIYFLTAVDLMDTRMGAGTGTQVIPAVPTSFTATADSDSIVLAWTENGTYDKVLIDRKSSGTYSQLASINGEIATYDDTSAVAGTLYTYRIRGLRNGYPSPYSSEASDTVPTVVLKAAQNAATMGNWLDAGNAAGLQVTKDDNFIVGGWIKWADSTDAVPFTKGDVNAGSESYGMFLTGATGIISVSSANGVSDTAIDANDPIVAATKSFVIMWVDATTINIKVNAGTTASTSISRTQVADPGGNFVLFANNDGSGGLGTKCVIDEWFFCKNPSSMSSALSLIASTIYNSGNGNHYANLTAGNITTLGLVSWWGLDEASGATRKDLNSTNDLTLHGTITQVSPLTV